MGSFLAQFDPSGHLTGLKQSENVTDQAAEEADIQSGANALVFRATGKYVKKVATGASEGSERTYDPLWANARTFLDYLTEHDLLVRDVRDARLGQFVLAKGSLILLDLTALKGAWGEGAMKKLVTQGLQQGVNREQRRAQGGAGKVDSDLFMALLKLLPHTVQARLIGDTANLWCVLDEASIVGSASDLFLKHGVMLDGDWSMVGVLDAYPYQPHPTDAAGVPLDFGLAGVAASAVGQLMVHLAPVARTLMGRPPSAFGVTPLLIFREIAGRPGARDTAARDGGRRRAEGNVPHD